MFATYCNVFWHLFEFYFYWDVFLLSSFFRICVSKREGAISGRTKEAGAHELGPDSADVEGAELKKSGQEQKLNAGKQETAAGNEGSKDLDEMGKSGQEQKLNAGKQETVVGNEGCKQLDELDKADKELDEAGQEQTELVKADEELDEAGQEHAELDKADRERGEAGQEQAELDKVDEELDELDKGLPELDEDSKEQAELCEDAQEQKPVDGKRKTAVESEAGRDEGRPAPKSEERRTEVLN